MLNAIIPQSLYRSYLLRRVSSGPLRKYLETPLPDKNSYLNDSEFLSLDFETTGLSADTDKILSIGYTLIRQGRIVLAENGYIPVDPDAELEEKNVVIHQIMDDHSKQGISFSVAIEILLEKIAGRTVIAHHANIERTFLDAACKKLYGHGLPLNIIDTLKMAKQRMEQQHQTIKPNSLRLFNLRNEYGLPRYNAHNALEDAIATAELFLAMASYRSNDINSCKVKDFL
ncbi:MAG: exonuclease domain-containing protein [Gammaproteobacteria bacterium]|nr:exonuclease domain-containing protein [Gammaproteobacteria bacterium]